MKSKTRFPINKKPGGFRRLKYLLESGSNLILPRTILLMLFYSRSNQLVSRDNEQSDKQDIILKNVKDIN